MKNKIKKLQPKIYDTPTRRLSIPRVMLALLVLVLLAGSSAYSLLRWQTVRVKGSNLPWFASYVDVTATPKFAFENMGATKNPNAILSFIVSSPQSACTPTWGGAYNLDEASTTLDLDRRIARLQQQGGSVGISFGGLNNHELAIGCTDINNLSQAYSKVINRYKVNTIDLDLEGDDLSNSPANTRRAKVIAKLQSTRRSHGKKLAVWVTLPVTPDGLSEAGTSAVAELLSQGVDLAGVNVMTMDYGSSLKDNQSMAQASQSALIQTQRQLDILYRQKNIQLTAASLWAKLSATPMIGQNDTPDEVFSLTDAQKFNKFAVEKGLGRMSMWSANRDITCGSNYVDTQIVSSSCSGVKQSNGETFARILSQGFKGSLANSIDLVTKSNVTSTKQVPDDPATSPYQIWSESGTYLEGTKVVWHHNVYQAKWWTQGNLPDSPTLQSWQTPWELIGPVLPGEKFVSQPTLPSGTYPEWSGTKEYNTKQRVMFEGAPYQAKWWNQGNSPAVSTSDPDSSPWVPLTQEQINAVNNK